MIRSGSNWMLAGSIHKRLKDKAPADAKLIEDFMEVLTDTNRFTMMARGYLRGTSRAGGMGLLAVEVAMILTCKRWRRAEALGLTRRFIDCTVS